MVHLRYSLVLAVLLRLMYAASVFYVARDVEAFKISGDSDSYLAPARQLAATGSYWNDDGPEIFRPPGYPVFLAPSLLTSNLWVATILVQTGLSALTVYLVYLLGRRLGDEAAGRWAALLFAVEPLTVMYSSTLMTETLMAFLIALAGLLLAISLERPSPLNLAWAATVVASLAYVKVVAYFLPIVLAGCLVAIGLARRSGLRYCGLALGFVVVCLLLFLPWHVRNYRVAEYAGFSTQIDHGIYMRAATAVRADQQGTGYGDARHASEIGFSNSREHNRNPDEWRTVRREGLAVLMKAPFRTLKVHSLGAAACILDPAAGRIYRQFQCEPTGFCEAARSQGYFSVFQCLRDMSPGRLVFIGSLALLNLSYLALCAMGMVEVAKARPSIVFVVIVIVAYFLFLSGAHGYHRFRVPLIPLFCVFAGCGLDMINAWIRRRFQSNYGDEA